MSAPCISLGGAFPLTAHFLLLKPLAAGYSNVQVGLLKRSIMKNQVAEIIESLESGIVTDAAAVAKLEQVTGRQIDLDWLRNYWHSESREDFVDRLCAEPITNYEQLTDSDALALIADYLQTDSPGRRGSIEAALHRRYGKPAGMLSDFVFQRNVSDPACILRELKKDTRIYL